MTATILLLMVASPLPDYALGQPKSDALLVVPIYSSPEKWALKCAGDEDAPEGLRVTAQERSAGVERCWTMEANDGVYERAAYPLRGAVRAEQEIEFLNGRIARIKVRYFMSPTDLEGRTRVSKKPKEAAIIDGLRAD